jgi:hypothetical protein
VIDSMNENLTQDYLLSLFDYRDGVLYRKVKPSRSHVDIRKPAGTVNASGYITIGISGKVYRAHRLIFLMHHGFLPKLIDHIDGDKKNNNIENMREATKKQNQHNRKVSINNKCGLKGVCFHKGNGKWVAAITINNKPKHIGYFHTSEEASSAYKSASLKHHGEFSVFHKNEAT